MTATQRRALWIGGLAGVGILGFAGLAMASTKSSGNNPPAPPPPKTGGDQGCFTPKSDCSDCQPGEVDFVVNKANNGSVAAGSYGPDLVPSTGRYLYWTKTKPGWAHIDKICATGG